MSADTGTITLGGGCFWCLEAVYAHVDGVLSVESGYSNGHVKAPTYEQVCGGSTGHAEVVRVATRREGPDAYPPGIAIRFLEMEAGLRARLARFVEEGRRRAGR